MRHSLFTCLFLLFILPLFVNLAGYPLVEPDEARNGEIVREIVEEGSWLPPRINGRVRYEKPPLYYWLAAVSYKIFGSWELSLRIISAFSALALAFVLFLWQGELAAFYFLSFLITFAYARIARMEMLLSLFIFLTLYFVWKNKILWASFFASLAFLTKGPVGVVIPAAVSLPLVWIGKVSLKDIFKGMILFLIIVVPVFLLLEAKTPGYCYNFFWKENVLRYTTGVFKREQPFYYFALVTLVGLSPWTFILFFRFKNILSLFFEDKTFWGFIFLWILFPTVFFSFSKSKLPHYILCVFPAWAVIFSEVFYNEDLIKKVSVFVFVIYTAAVLVLFPWYSRKRSFAPLAKGMMMDIPVYILDEKIYGASLYTGRIAKKIESVGEIKDDRFWLVLKRKKEKYLNLSNYMIIKKLTHPKFEALLLERKKAEK